MLFEAPPRVAATLGDLAGVCGGDRPVAIVREITKVHEETFRGDLAAALAHVEAQPPRGEHVLVLGGAPAAAPATDDDVAEAAREELAAGASTRAAADAVAARLGVSRRRAYDAALAERSS